MTRAASCILVFALTSPIGAQEDGTVRSESTSSGGIVTATVGRFNLARPPEGRETEDGARMWVPRSERWRMHWKPADLNEYARQLDYFRIQLAATSGEQPLLHYASKVSQPRPDSEQGTAATEKRLCMTWNEKGGELVGYDTELLGRAGISATNRKLLQFYPAEVEDRLAFIEMENAQREGRELEDFRVTTFGVKPKGNGYELYVECQEFRQAPR